MEKVLKKVTAFITREKDGEIQLLLFEHPNAGIQIPGGTVEIGENHIDAAVREAFEETGMENLELKSDIGYMDSLLQEDEFVVVEKTKVYARPDLNSFDWAEYRLGLPVKYKYRKESGFVHVIYEEEDQYPNVNYITYSIMGWVPEDSLSKKVRRYFVHLEVKYDTPNEWCQFTDNHNFKLFWAPLSNLPQIVYPQNKYIDYVIKDLNYTFK